MPKVNILPNDAAKHPRKMYQVVCYMRVDPADGLLEPLTLAEAYAEAEQAGLMQPENKYVVELVDGAE